MASRRETLDVAHEGNECRRLVQASGNVRDTFVLSDPSLPLNAPVNFVVSGTLDAAVSTVGGGSIGGQAYATAVIVVSGSFGSSVIGGPEGVCFGIGIPNLNLCTDFAMPKSRFFVSFAGKNGEVVSLKLPVGGYSQSDAGRLRLRPLVLWRNRGDGGRRSHDTVNVDPTTLGESILSGSGHDYSTLATPEPSSALLLSAGVGVLASLGRRRWPRHTRAEGRASLRPSGRGGLDVPI